jgi:phosphoglycerate kinase
MYKMSDLNLANKNVLIRVDLNVPMQDNKITSTKRIEAILPTIRMALNQNASVILMSHLGRPTSGEFSSEFSLAPVAACLSHLLDQTVTFVQALDQLNATPGQVILLENTRFWVGEKENDEQLSQRLASLCDVFVMDAFATAHRKEASTYGVAKYAPIACAGPLLVKEMASIASIMHNPARPLLAIVGGSKVSSKLAVLKSLLTRVDSLIVGGGIANTFLAAQGFSVGDSLYEPELVDEAKKLLQYAKDHGKVIPLPLDVVVAKQFSKEAQPICRDIQGSGLAPGDIILDVGHKTSAQFTDVIQKAKTILWNGPVGVFEWDQFAQGTKSLAEAIAKSTAYSVAGGGDTIAAIEKYGIESDISYISTGGGAFLEFLEGKKLPAIAILEQRANDKVSHETN